MRQNLLFSCLIVAGLMSGFAEAGLTPAQKRELKEIGNDAIRIGPLIAKKKFSDATTAIKDIEDRLTKFISDAGLKADDSVLKFVHTQIEKAKAQLAKALEKGGPSFEKAIATTLARKCVECHADEPKGGLRLDTFEGMEKGGKSGNLIVVGDPESSLLVQRLIAPDVEHRMPLGKEPLLDKEIHSIATWIADGAPFEGDKTATMDSMAKAAMASKQVPSVFGKKTTRPEVTKESGNETVHFMPDIMPELVDTCGRCHNDKDKRSGFSVMSFEKLMKGGDSGAVITPGSLESSRLWRLVNGDDTPVMPAGNDTGITRKWHANLKTWITEGAKFDGTDPKKNFPSLQERESAALAKYTPEQWLERRKNAAEEAWKKTFPTTAPHRRESKEFLLYGDVADERLEQIEKWAGEQSASLKQSFKVKIDPLWQGKLAVFVFNERFGYEEFNTSVHRRDVSREVLGHAQVDPSLEDAFIALQDIGDTVSETSPGMRVNVMTQVTGAFLKRGGRLPEWVVLGTGLALAHQKSTANPYLSAMPRQANRILQESNLKQPDAIFDEETFSPGDLGPVGCTLVEFLLKRENLNQFGQFVQALQTGSSPATALKSIYHADGNTLALAYSASLPSGGKKSKK